MFNMILNNKDGWDTENWDNYVKDVEQQEAEEREKEPFDYFPNMDNPLMVERAELLRFFQSSPDCEHQQNLQQGLASLPFFQRVVLRGYFEAELTTKAIAKELNTSQNSVRKAKSRAMKKLRSFLMSKKEGVTLGANENPIKAET